MTALELFRAGHDTAQIAHILRMSEAQALKALTLQRASDLGLASPYSGEPVNLSVRPPVSCLMEYAGR